MRFTKTRLSSAEQGYSINALTLLGAERVVAAPEGPGPSMIFTPKDGSSAILGEEPGGCMGFAPVPGRDDALIVISRFYPIFKAETAGLHLFAAVDGLSKPWHGTKILDLPFVHRIAGVTNGSESYLVAATVCGGKDFQDDWSRPGKVFVAEFPDSPEQGMNLVPVLEGVHRNHGMTSGEYKGQPCVYISGDEGIYAIQLPPPGGKDWKSEKIFDRPVSELSFADLDGDGEEELAVIEPFHGETLSVYKRRNDSWETIYTAKLAFGHGLWAGTLAGEPSIIVGNRAATNNLVCYRTVSDSPFSMEEIVVDEGSGTTNLDVIKTEDGDAVVASNAEHAEYAFYAVDK